LNRFIDSQQNLKSEFAEIIAKGNQDPFKDYIDILIQRIPRYAVKPIGSGSWISKNKPLSDIPIKAHLDGKYFIAILGKWYPAYCILDIDHRIIEYAEEVRKALGLDPSNSMMCDSESPTSYHLLIRPQYNGKPPTLKLLQDVLRSFAQIHKIEIYPQQRRVIRLPFGLLQKCLDPEYMFLETWQDKLYRFQKLDEFDLSEVKDHQMGLEFPFEKKSLEAPGTMSEASDLFKYGLQQPSSRHYSQMKIIYSLWRKNIPQATVERIVWNWIQKLHNGFSFQIIHRPRSVREEIHRQAEFYYSKNQRSEIYPDSTHNTFQGYITKLDLGDIIEICSASFPKMKFLFELIKYCYPRRHRRRVEIHTSRLQTWASAESYLKRIEEATEKGIVKRYRSYQVGERSKSFDINWKWRSSQDAILHDGRSIETLKSTLKSVYKAQDLRERLQAAGGQKSTISRAIKDIFGP